MHIILLEIPKKEYFKSELLKKILQGIALHGTITLTTYLKQESTER